MKKNFFTPISVSLLPNLFKKDIKLAWKTIISFQGWVRGREIEKLEKEFAGRFQKSQAVSFASGRTALLAILKALGIGVKDEVLVQSFTCVVVLNSVLKTGARPIYVDINQDTFNMDPADLSAKITSRCKAIIVQHTFGYPAEMEKIVRLAKEKNLLVIEDCAHGFGYRYQGKLIGELGDAAFFSFGRDKVISSVFGGMAITRNPSLAQKIRAYQKALPYPSAGWVVKQLAYPLFFRAALSVYHFFSLGKILIFLYRFGGLISLPVTEEEKSGQFPKQLLSRLPNGLAILVRSQLRRLNGFNLHRRRLVKYYADNLSSLPIGLPVYETKGSIIPLLRFTVRTKQSQQLYEFAKSRKVILNNWYYPSISPAGVDYSEIGYNPATCPTAESVSAQVVNLPTHPKIDKQAAGKVVAVIKEFFDKS